MNKLNKHNMNTMLGLHWPHSYQERHFHQLSSLHVESTKSQPRILSTLTSCLLPDVKPSMETAAPEGVEADPESGGSLPTGTGAGTAPLHKRHKTREHKRVYRCSLCSKVFQNSSNLNRHIRSHGTTARPRPPLTILLTLYQNIILIIR